MNYVSIDISWCSHSTNTLPDLKSRKAKICKVYPTEDGEELPTIRVGMTTICKVYPTLQHNALFGLEVGMTTICKVYPTKGEEVISIR